jgi:predicted  nucleic acid-binding Zn-ribbon protein
MKTELFRVIQMAFLACLFTGCAKNSDVAALKSEIADLKKGINSLNSSISELDDRIDKQANLINAVDSRIGEVEVNFRQKSDEEYTRAQVDIKFDQIDSELSLKIGSDKFDDLERRVESIDSDLGFKADSEKVTDLEMQIDALKRRIDAIQQ